MFVFVFLLLLPNSFLFFFRNRLSVIKDACTYNQRFRAAVMILFKLTYILKTNSHFFWHFPVLNMEGISNFVIILLHCYRSTRCSRCTRRLSGQVFTLNITAILFIRSLFQHFRHVDFCVTLNSHIFDFVAICLS